LAGTDFSEPEIDRFVMDHHSGRSHGPAYRSLQPLSPIQNNSDLAQGPLPIRPSKVRRKLPHVAAEL